MGYVAAMSLAGGGGGFCMRPGGGTFGGGTFGGGMLRLGGGTELMLEGTV